MSKEVFNSWAVFASSNLTPQIAGAVFMEEKVSSSGITQLKYESSV